MAGTAALKLALLKVISLMSVTKLATVILKPAHAALVTKLHRTAVQAGLVNDKAHSRGNAQKMCAIPKVIHLIAILSSSTAILDNVHIY